MVHLQMQKVMVKIDIREHCIRSTQEAGTSSGISRRVIRPAITEVG